MGKKEVEIYTDGACSGNPGPGGYGAILNYKGTEKIISGGESETTNNRMELSAVIKALETLKESCIVNLYTDSAYVYNAVKEGWINDWQISNWKNSQKKPVANKDLWLELIDMLSFHNVTMHKVKGHSTNEKNNRCDEIARNEIIKLERKNTEI